MVKNIDSAEDGSRAYPAISKRLDEACGVRLDFGQKFTGQDGVEYRNIVLQPNKNAKHEGFRKMANQNSHQKLAVVAIPVKKEIRGEMSSDSFF